MPRRIRVKLTYANVVSTLCVFVVLGGSATAATTLLTGKNVKNGSLTGADVKDNALGSRDIKDGDLLAKDFKPGQLIAGAPGAKGDTGAAGAKGDKGDKGDTGQTGPRGPSDGYVTQDAGVAATKTTSLVLPAGNFIVTAVQPLFNANGTNTTANGCVLSSAEDAAHFQQLYTTIVPGGYATVTGTTAQALPSGGTVKLVCTAVAGVSYGPSSLTAVQVGTLH